ncbi:hypothetical protein [Cytobacillus praedii]|uniref:hypothetical protein n=1 Tax=Cytobacillus praedii TaxID=1742358 RepID=UPI002E1A0CF3|nr:hypothetical protein [Cytobacillus praedii]
MIKNFETFLQQNNIIPLDNGEWKLITVDHTSMDSKTIKAQIRKDLQGYITGVYVYTSLSGDVYYVGQGKLKSRVIKKYQQATSQKNEIPTSRGLFFRSKMETMKVYVMNVEGYMEQIALEAMLSTILNPEYLDFLKEYNARKKSGSLENWFKEIRQLQIVTFK